MTNAAPTLTLNPSLDAMYGMIAPDLKQVDALILSRVQNDVPLIGEVARHIVASGGKRIRPALTLICARLCGLEIRRAVARATAIEFIHTATLLHDDVVDESKLRRGLPTANETFGNKASILVGDFLLSQAFQLAVEDKSLDVLKILADASSIISKGEVLQLMVEGDLDTTIEQYLNVISAKTAALFAAACEVGAAEAATPQEIEKLNDFGIAIGIAFQLVDDVLDYAANQAMLGKTVGDDFREGKITLPVIFAYQAGNEEEKAFWQRTMSDKNQQEGDLQRAMSLFSKHQAIGQSMEYVESYCAKARNALSAFSSTPAKAAMLDLVEFCASRGY